MPAIKLPLLPGSTPTIGGEAEQLAAFLAPVNDPSISQRIGQEQVSASDGPWLTTAGEKFRSREGWVQGLRYLCLDAATGSPIAALNVSLRSTGRKVVALASNVYVAPSHRRQGLARELMRRAQSDFPRLCADEIMTDAGAALVGHAQGLPRPRARRPG